MSGASKVSRRTRPTYDSLIFSAAAISAMVACVPFSSMSRQRKLFSFRTLVLLYLLPFGGVSSRQPILVHPPLGILRRAPVVVIYVWDSVHGRLASRHPREHLPTRTLAGQDDGVHFVLRDPCHLPHVPERPFNITDSRRLVPVLATSRTPAIRALISPRVQRLRWARSGRSIVSSCVFRKLRPFDPATESRNVTRQ
jgi:hypothetical protein